MKLTSLLIFPVLAYFACTPDYSQSNSHLTDGMDTSVYQVAFLIMDGVFNTELTAPFDIFQHTKYRKNIKPMRVFTVANTRNPITTFEGIRILPDYNYVSDSLPSIDILVVPSAEHHLDSDLDDANMIQFVKLVAEEASFLKND